MVQPELLLRLTVAKEYSEKSSQITLEDVEEMLKEHPGCFWNSYSMFYGVEIKDFPYAARNGYFVDIERRVATHRFESKGIARRDQLFKEDIYKQLIHPVYRKIWFDREDAVRSYAILITDVQKLEEEIAMENFGLFNSLGNISSRDQIQRPRLIKPLQ